MKNRTRLLSIVVLTFAVFASACTYYKSYTCVLDGESYTVSIKEIKDDSYITFNGLITGRSKYHVDDYAGDYFYIFVVLEDGVVTSAILKNFSRANSGSFLANLVTNHDEAYVKEFLQYLILQIKFNLDGNC